MLGRLRARALVVAIASSPVCVPALGAQRSFLPRSSAPLVVIGGSGEDRLRLDQLLGRASLSGWMARTPSLLTPPLVSDSIVHSGWLPCAATAAYVPLAADFTWNSRIPVERNDGGQWAGRGATLHAMGGVRIACGRLRLHLAPEAWYAQNRGFPIVPGSDSTRSGFANPFHQAPTWSTDIPIRFGDQPLLVLEPGQSVLELDLDRAAVGVATESQWWGPAIRNAIVMSNHAAGIPNAYLRTARPVRTFLGDFDARWTLGALTQSRFFYKDERSQLRSLSGLLVTLRTRFDSGLTVGGARVVYALVPGAGALPARFLDAVARWGEGLNVQKATSGRGSEQLTTLFARWVLPGSHVEAYGEWARVILPRSLRALLVAPQFSQGYTVGFQWLGTDYAIEPAWRVQAEATMLEQPYQSRAVDPPTFYVSPTVPQGYTQRGQAIGAMIGPGSSSQWLALDRITRRQSIGGFVGRIRWDNDAFYRQPTGLGVWAHDVSLYGGLRATRALGHYDVSAELLAEQRLNYLFQSATVGFMEDRTFDVRNLSLRFSMQPRVITH